MESNPGDMRRGVVAGWALIVLANVHLALIHVPGSIPGISRSLGLPPSLIGGEFVHPLLLAFAAFLLLWEADGGEARGVYLGLLGVGVSFVGWFIFLP